MPKRPPIKRITLRMPAPVHRQAVRDARKAGISLNAHLLLRITAMPQFHGNISVAGLTDNEVLSNYRLAELRARP